RRCVYHVFLLSELYRLLQAVFPFRADPLHGQRRAVLAAPSVEILLRADKAERGWGLGQRLPDMSILRERANPHDENLLRRGDAFPPGILTGRYHLRTDLHRLRVHVERHGGIEAGPRKAERDRLAR